MRLIEAEAPQEIEALAQHCAQLLIKKQLAEKKEKQSINEEQDFESINAVSSSENKRIGSEHVGLEAMKSLGFFDLFQQLGFTQRQSDLATLLIVGRYVHPSSERELRRYAKEQSALDELLGTSFSHIGNYALYRTSDLLFEHKDQIERFLRVGSKEIFSLKETIWMDDLLGYGKPLGVKEYWKI